MRASVYMRLYTQTRLQRAVRDSYVVCDSYVVRETCAPLYACLHVCIYVYTCLHVCIYVYTCLYAIRLYACLCVCIWRLSLFRGGLAQVLQMRVEEPIVDWYKNKKIEKSQLATIFTV